MLKCNMVNCFYKLKLHRTAFLKLLKTVFENFSKIYIFFLVAEFKIELNFSLITYHLTKICIVNNNPLKHIGIYVYHLFWHCQKSAHC
jgi:hypothetical protein